MLKHASADVGVITYVVLAILASMKSQGSHQQPVIQSIGTMDTHLFAQVSIPCRCAFLCTIICAPSAAGHSTRTPCAFGRL